MKKIFIGLITLFLCIQNVNAEVDVYTRTESNYLVPSDIEVSSSNKKDILSTPAVDSSLKIYDFGDLLTDQQEGELFSKVIDYINENNYDLAIVTINKNNKFDAESYADDFFDYNDFGINSSRDGALILIDMDTREIYISTSGYAQKMYNDSRIDNIIDAGFNYLTSEMYYMCLSKMIDKLDYYYDSGYPSGNSNLYIDENGNAYYINRMPYLIIILISGFVCFGVSSFLYFKTSSKIKKQNTVTYINPNITNIIKDDRFITTHTSRIRIDTSSSSSGGGRSSFHSGSSGRSHGGGGRHF